jgi:methionyl-tRNA formyltransferase
MRVIFFGTPRFSKEILNYLLDHGVDIAAVVCQPAMSDDEDNNAVYTFARIHFADDKILRPMNADDEIFLERLINFKADLFVVVSYGQILKQRLLDIPLLGCINVHGSLLPKYRGAAPIQRAIMNGDEVTGITVMKMTKKMDAGDMMAIKEVVIGHDDNYVEVERKMWEVAAPLLLEVINNFSIFSKDAYKQDESKVTFANKIGKEEFFINWKQSATSIHNKVRGLYPDARCYVEVNGKRKLFKILASSVVENFSKEAGSIVKMEDGELIVGCGEGALKLLKVQLEGKKPLVIDEFLKGVQRLSIQ